MKTISLVLLYEPMKSHIGSVMSRANDALQLGAIKALPVIGKRPSIEPNFWVLTIETTEADWPFWFGFYLGKDFTVQNRQIVLGVD